MDCFDDQIARPRASYDYTPVLVDVLARGGDVTICAMRGEDTLGCCVCAGPVSVHSKTGICQSCSTSSKKRKRG